MSGKKYRINTYEYEETYLADNGQNFQYITPWLLFIIPTFLHHRAPWYFVERKRAFPDLPLPNPNWLRKDFDTCVRRGDKECQYLEGE